MTGKKIGYIRVSTVDQNPERQLEGMDLDKKFIDYASGTTTDRPSLQSMLQYVREDDTVYVHSMDRLARNVRDLLKLVQTFSEKQVELKFVKENLSFNGKDCALSNLLLVVIGAVCEFEHSLIRERQREGIAIAKKMGKFKPGKKKVPKEKLDQMKFLLETTRKSKSEIAREVGISRFTLYQYKKKMGI